MIIQIDQEQLTALTCYLRELAIRYEVEAAAFASLKEAGREMAEERLADARDAEELENYLLGQ